MTERLPQDEMGRIDAPDLDVGDIGLKRTTNAETKEVGFWLPLRMARPGERDDDPYIYAWCARDDDYDRFQGVLDIAHCLYHVEVVRVRAVEGVWEIEDERIDTFVGQMSDDGVLSVFQIKGWRGDWAAVVHPSNE